MKIDEVNCIKYLGVLINREGSIEAEVGEKIAKTSRLHYSLANKLIRRTEISKVTKTIVYKTVLTYGSESWFNVSNTFYRQLT